MAEEELREPPPLYIVMTSAAKSKGKWTHTRRNVAIVRTDEETWPAMISDRARGVLEIVNHWEALNVGTTDRSAYAKALAYCQRQCARLNHEARPLGTAAREAAERARA